MVKNYDLLQHIFTKHEVMNSSVHKKRVHQSLSLKLNSKFYVNFVIYYEMIQDTLNLTTDNTQK